LAAGTASAAGSCGAEVAALQQQLGHQDTANATIGATDPRVQQPENTDATADSSGSSTTTTESGTTTADSSTTMPSGDVTETSRVGDLNTAAGGHAEAITALKKAQLVADAGDATCMTELGTAKAAMGVQ
jgi:hypothetical protein